MNSIKVQKNSIIVFITVVFSLLFIFPNDYKHLVPYGSVVLSTITILLLFISYFKFFPTIIKYIKKNIVFSIPFICSFIATIIHNPDNINVAIQNIMYLFMFYLLGSFYEKNKSLIKISEYISFAIITINLITMLFLDNPISFSSTGGRIYFIFEGSIGKLLMANILLFFLGENETKPINFIAHYLVYILTISLISFSATNYYGCMALLIYMTIVKIIKTPNIFISFIKIYIIILVLLNILVITGYLSDSLSSFFNKSITLSGRTIIWKSALDVIKNHFLIGVGEYRYDYLIKLTGIRGATHVHNQILQVLMNSGVIGLSVYFYYFSKLGKLKSKIKLGTKNIYYVGYLLTIIALGITGIFFDNFFYLSFLIFFNHLNEGEEEKC